MPPKIKLCPKCRAQFQKKGARGGRNGSNEDKQWASHLAAEARAQKAKRITFRGETLTVSEWSDKLGIHRSTIWARLRCHLPVERVLQIK